MANDDPLTRFKSKLDGKRPTASAVRPSDQPWPDDLAESERADFANKVRPVCVELRCHRSGLSYSIPYAHIGAIVFHFRTGQELSFTGAGFGVTIRGRNLEGIALALRLHSCSLIEDQGTEGNHRPDSGGPLVESIRVEPLVPAPKKREAENA